MDEEAELDTQSHAALTSARMLRAREASPVRRDWRGFGVELLGTTVEESAEQEAPLDEPAAGAARVVKRMSAEEDENIEHLAWLCVAA